MSQKIKYLFPTHCPICELPLTGIQGTPTSPFLIGGFRAYDFAENDRDGNKFRTSTLSLLRQELGSVQIYPDDVALLALWQHEANDSQECLYAHLQLFIQACLRRKAVLLIGRELCEVFLHAPVLDYSGMWAASPLLPDVPLMVMPSPLELLQGRGLGEIRLALQRFATKVGHHA